jgi:2-polyprenyl-6-hydroxyphenyl methylase/3-demethylubiquinone-9 3-methyltransferase
MHRATTDQHAMEVVAGDRFEFGKNWARFLALVDDRRIEQVEASLRRMLKVDTLEGKTFVDVGSGSGLFSLAARRLGARVTSFDFDPASVACTRELRRRYFPGDGQWAVESGSILDDEYVARLGAFDVVYSWGVLHHTGQMWKALVNVDRMVARDGLLYIAIYNDLGSRTARWRMLKRMYNKLPQALRVPYAIAVSAPGEVKSALRSLASLRPRDYVRSWTEYDSVRGMSHWRDVVDWVGGYPYEVAKPEEIFEFYRERGYELRTLKCGNVGLGCNEFVFARRANEVGA